VVATLIDINDIVAKVHFVPLFLKLKSSAQ
jgi:hypothetical protein